MDRTRRRRHETAHDVVRRRLEKILTHPDHGIAEQLAPLSDAYQQVNKPDQVMQWLNTPQPGTVLLRELAIRAHSEPVTHDLLDSYPQTYTLHHLRDLFVYAGILPDRAEFLERIQPWLDQVLSDRPQHHATLVRPFATWHALRRARQRDRRRPTTASSATYVRSQVTIALNFLSWLDGHGQTLTTANQSDLDLWLEIGTQTNYFLATFITWAKCPRPLRADRSPPAAVGTSQLPRRRGPLEHAPAMPARPDHADRRPRSRNTHFAVRPHHNHVHRSHRR